jgi:drug/metabolite transporter (DMT)-like permease
MQRLLPVAAGVVAALAGLCSKLLSTTGRWLFLFLFLNVLSFVLASAALRSSSSSLRATSVCIGSNIVASAGLGYALLRESLTGRYALGVTLIVLGVTLVHRKPALKRH